VRIAEHVLKYMINLAPGRAKMKLAEISDDGLLDEVKHRGFRIEMITDKTTRDFKEWEKGVDYIKIGGIRFELST